MFQDFKVQKDWESLLGGGHRIAKCNIYKHRSVSINLLIKVSSSFIILCSKIILFRTNIISKLRRKDRKAAIFNHDFASRFSNRTLEEFLMIQRIEGTRIFSFETKKDLLLVWHLTYTKHYVSEISRKELYVYIKNEPILRNVKCFRKFAVSPKSSLVLACSASQITSWFVPPGKKFFVESFEEIVAFRNPRLFSSILAILAASALDTFSKISIMILQHVQITLFSSIKTKNAQDPHQSEIFVSRQIKNRTL